MQDLMNFSDVSAILSLDPRDEKRNRLLLAAISEEICLYLNRNLLTATTTETHETTICEFYPDHYPVREFTAITDEQSTTPILLTPESVPPDLLNPDAHRLRPYKIQGNTDRSIHITYRYGYAQSEIPSLIQAYLIDTLRDRLVALSASSEADSAIPNRLTTITAYQRILI